MQYGVGRFERVLITDWEKIGSWLFFIKNDMSITSKASICPISFNCIKVTFLKVNIRALRIPNTLHVAFMFLFLPEREVVVEKRKCFNNLSRN